MTQPTDPMALADRLVAATKSEGNPIGLLLEAANALRRPAVTQGEGLEAIRAALFEPREADAFDNLDGALIDIKRFSEAGKPTDAVCIRTIERVLNQLAAAHAVLQHPPETAPAERVLEALETFADKQLTEQCWKDLFEHLDEASLGFARKWKERLTKLRAALASLPTPDRAAEFSRIVSTKFEDVSCAMPDDDCEWPECNCPRTDSLKGTSQCPICHNGSPHTHSEEEIQKYRRSPALYAEAWRKFYAGTDHHPVYRRIFIEGGLYALDGDARQ